MTCAIFLTFPAAKIFSFTSTRYFSKCIETCWAIAKEFIPWMCIKIWLCSKIAFHLHIYLILCPYILQFRNKFEDYDITCFSTSLVLMFIRCKRKFDQINTVPASFIVLYIHRICRLFNWLYILTFNYIVIYLIYSCQTAVVSVICPLKVPNVFYLAHSIC